MSFFWFWRTPAVTPEEPPVEPPGEDEQEPFVLSTMPTMFTGDRPVNPIGIDEVGKILVEQTQPYPMTVLAIYGDIQFGSP